jgi:hypothetical protein
VEVVKATSQPEALNLLSAKAPKALELAQIYPEKNSLSSYSLLEWKTRLKMMKKLTLKTPQLA